jgi:hypothetical protein
VLTLILCAVLYKQVLLAIVKYAAAANLLAMLTTFFANIEPLLKAWPLSIDDQRRLFLLVADVLGKVINCCHYSICVWFSLKFQRH